MSQVKVTICGSYRKHLDRIVEAKREFEKLGATVLRPRAETPVESADDELVRLEGDPAERRAVRAAQFEAIADSDLVYIVNPGGYVGSSATLEVGYAHRTGTPVVAAEEPFEADVADVVAAVGDPAAALRCLTERRASE